MIGIINLMEIASKRLSGYDLELLQKTNVVLQAIRAVEAVPHKRLKVNGHLHRQLASALVIAAENDEEIMIQSRHQGDLFDAKLSTSTYKWLDKLVSTGLLVSQSKQNKAEGRLSVSDTIKDLVKDPALESA
jgi:spore germination protein GerM|eukprot:COSAG02_NODE_3106_length_7354_cov_3.928754_8_plen_132_part_00